jgi:Na+(H+)/acetate symporter ActP
MIARYVGWFMFLAGVVVYVVLGEMTVRTTGGKVGAFIMISGMILSAAATIMMHMTEYRKRQQRIIELRADREPTKEDGPPPPPPPPG